MSRLSGLKYGGGATSGFAPVLETDDLLMPPQFQGATDTSTGGGGSATSSLAPETISYAASGLVFMNTYGSGVSTTFRNEIVAAENYFQAHFTNSCTIRCSFDLQSLSPGISGQNSFYGTTVTYSTFVNALASHATSADDRAVVASLQKLADPTHGYGVFLPLGEARILGLAGSSTYTDDAVVLNSYYWSSTALQNNPNDAIDVILHEISEGGMGRIGALGIDGSSFEPMDFLRFTASGQRDFTGGKDGVATYFSTDGSSVNTGLQYHNSVNASGAFDGYDFADWDGVGADSNYNDPFGPGGPGAGGTGQLSATDLRIMDVLGWTQTGTQPPTKKPPKHDDFYGNGTSDILYRNDASGDAWFAAVSNGGFNGWNHIGGSDTHYSMAGTGDFYGNGTSDMLYRNSSTGDTWFEAMSNGNFAGWHQVGGSDTHYAVAGVGDFDSNGSADILFRNNSTGDTWYEAMSNGNFAGWHQVGGSDTHYAVAGVGDFDGNGSADILFRNNSTGDTWYEAMSNGNFAGWHQVGGSDTRYAVVGVGDFYGNGTSDILFFNNATGDARYAAMSNGAFGSWQQVGTFDSHYSVVGVGDYYGNGTSDILFRNNASGDTAFAAMSNGSYTGWHGLGGSNTSYSVKT